MSTTTIAPPTANERAAIKKAMALVQRETTDPFAAQLEALQREGRHMEAMLLGSSRGIQPVPSRARKSK